MKVRQSALYLRRFDESGGLLKHKLYIMIYEHIRIDLNCTLI